jgi:hypothetical protein
VEGRGGEGRGEERREEGRGGERRGKKPLRRWGKTDRDLVRDDLSEMALCTPTPSDKEVPAMCSSFRTLRNI